MKVNETSYVKQL